MYPIQISSYTRHVVALFVLQVVIVILPLQRYHVRFDFGELQRPDVRLDSSEQVMVDDQPRR